MSNDARHRDIAALLASGVVRVRRQPMVAKAIESNMPSGDENSTDKPLHAEITEGDEASQEHVELTKQTQQGGDQ